MNKLKLFSLGSDEIHLSDVVSSSVKLNNLHEESDLTRISISFRESTSFARPFFEYLNNNCRDPRSTLLGSLRMLPSENVSVPKIWLKDIFGSDLSSFDLSGKDYDVENGCLNPISLFTYFLESRCSCVYLAKSCEDSGVLDLLVFDSSAPSEAYFHKKNLPLQIVPGYDAFQ